MARTPLYKYQLLMPYGCFADIQSLDRMMTRGQVDIDDLEIEECRQANLTIHNLPPKKPIVWWLPKLLMGKKGLGCRYDNRIEGYVITVHSEEMNDFVQKWFVQYEMGSYGCSLVKARI